jgi:hypothetical protein
MYLFGGENCNAGFKNELWLYNRLSGKWTWMKGTNTQQGIYGTIGIPNSNNYPGSRMDALGWSDGSGDLWLFGGSSFDATGAYGEQNDLWHISNCTLQTLQINSTNTLLCTGQTTTLLANGASSYKWNTGQSGNTIIVSPGVSSVFTVTSTDLQSCGNQATIAIQISDCAFMRDEVKLLQSATIFPNPNNGNFRIYLPDEVKEAILKIYSSQGRLVIEKSVHVADEIICNELMQGLYYYEVVTRTNTLGRTKLIIE